MKGVVHWVSARHAVDAKVRLYDRLFSVDNPDAAAGEAGDFTDFIAASSLEVVESAKLERSIVGAKPGEQFQFVRVGYFVVDAQDSADGALVFNRTVSLKDSFAKQSK